MSIDQALHWEFLPWEHRIQLVLKSLKTAHGESVTSGGAIVSLKRKGDMSEAGHSVFLVYLCEYSGAL